MPDQPPTEIVWLLKAETDFQAIYNRISGYSEERAERFYFSVNDALDQVKLFPEIGQPYALPIRRVLALQARFGVFYRRQFHRIVVLGIEDLRQSPDRIRRNLGLE
jgi:plasmid stabilization system protein ParE